jgi:hypothetical protein
MPAKTILISLMNSLIYDDDEDDEESEIMK